MMSLFVGFIVFISFYFVDLGSGLFGLNLWLALVLHWEARLYQAWIVIFYAFGRGFWWFSMVEFALFVESFGLFSLFGAKIFDSFGENSSGFISKSPKMLNSPVFFLSVLFDGNHFLNYITKNLFQSTFRAVPWDVHFSPVFLLNKLTRPSYSVS